MPILLYKQYTRREPAGDAGIEADIAARLQAGCPGSFIHVVPTKRKLRDAARSCILASPGGAAPALALFTLDSLAADLHGILCPPKRLVEGPAQAVLINEALQHVRPSLGYFRLRRGLRLPKGTFQKIVNVINTLKEQGVYPALLHQELNDAGADEQLKLRDILLVYEEYEQLLGGTFIDPAGRIKGVNECWSRDSSPEQVRAHFPDADTLFVSGFDKFSDPEITMLHHLSGVPRLATVISFDYHPGNEEIFGHLKENYGKFLEIGFSPAAHRRPQTVAASSHAPAAPTGAHPAQPAAAPAAASAAMDFAAHIAAHCFRHDAGAGKLDCTKSITLLDAEDREKEAELVARLVKQLAVERPGRDLSKICIATFEPQRYANLFREVLARYGIPANVTDRFALDQSPFVVSVLSLLAVQQNNFRLTDIMRALASPYFSFAPHAGAAGRARNGAGGGGGGSDEPANVDAGNLYEVATRLKVTVGKSAWDSRIEQQLRLVAASLAEAGDEIEESQLRREQQMLRKAQKDIARVAAALSPFSGLMSPLTFKENVVELLKKLRTLECLVKVPPALIGDEQLERDVRAYQKFLNFLDEFLGILLLEREEGSAPEGGELKKPLSFYMERLRAAIPQVRYNVRQKYGYGVQVTSFDETRGLSFDVMVMTGLVDGEFPPVCRPEIFFSSARRSAIERYHLVEHRYLFYQALTNFSEHLYITVPRCDDDAPLVPSSFIASLLHVAAVDDRRGSPRAEESPGPIFSEDELLQHLGRIAGREHPAAVEREFARYPDLLETLEQMRRAIAVEKSRIGDDPAAMPQYQGRIGGHVHAAGIEALGRLRHRVYSVTQLESYGSCPFQFFADKVLRLHSVPEARDGVSPLERGGVLHELLFEFYTARRERRGGSPSLAGCTDTEFGEALRDLLTRARAKLDALTAFDIFWDVEKELILGTKNRKGILEEFLDRERNSTLAVQPKYFEAAFGFGDGAKGRTDSRLTHPEPIAAGEVQLRGKIDRIDTGGGLLTILDYKTGARLAGRREIDLGMSLQLPIYLYAVERMLSEKEERDLKGAAGVYYQLRSPVQAKLGIGDGTLRGAAFESSSRNANLLPGGEELHDIIAQAIAYVNGYVDGISRGEFAVEPKDPSKVCEYCAFSAICRIRSRVGPAGGEPGAGGGGDDDTPSNGVEADGGGGGGS